MPKKQKPEDSKRRDGKRDPAAAGVVTPPPPPRITPLSSPLGLEQRIADLLEAGQQAVLMTVISREGSAPRGAGTRALLTSQGLLGTVGGGALEAAALDMARQCLASGLSACHRCSMDGSADTDMICGGSMEVLCESLSAAQAPLFQHEPHFLLRRSGADIERQTLPPVFQHPGDAGDERAAAHLVQRVGGEALAPLLRFLRRDLPAQHFPEEPFELPVAAHAAVDRMVHDETIPRLFPEGFGKACEGTGLDGHTVQDDAVTVKNDGLQGHRFSIGKTPGGQRSTPGKD